MEKYIDYKKDAYLIDLINDSYHYHKMLLKEVENGIKDYDFMRVRVSHKIVSHIENVIDGLNGKIRLIIDSEIIGNKKGTKWYTEYFSTPSYYRARKIAYRLFLEKIEK